MATKYVYKIRNKKNGNFFHSYSYFSSEGKEFKTEAGARNALDYFVRSNINRKLWDTALEDRKLTAENMSKLFPYDLEITKVKVVYTDDGVIPLDTTVKNIFLARNIQSRNINFGRFWDNAMKKGYADQIEYIVQLDIIKGTPRADAIKEARSQLRLLGVKTRTFREYNGMFGFYNRDQAFKARLTLNAKDFIDVAELKKELFV